MSIQQREKNDRQTFFKFFSIISYEYKLVSGALGYYKINNGAYTRESGLKQNIRRKM